MFERKHAPFVVVATVLMTSQPLLTTLSKVHGHYQYVQISTTLLAEATKFLLSAALYLRLPRAQHSHAQLSAGHVVPFGVPAAIYFVNNNLIFLILSYVNSTTYQILSALKARATIRTALSSTRRVQSLVARVPCVCVPFDYALAPSQTVFTGLLFRVVLKRRLTDLQMLAIVLLGCGTATSQIGTSACVTSEVAPSSSVGVIAAVLTCLLSALGGVYSERLMKHDAKLHSLHLQNMLLYGWGVLFNLFGMFGADGGRVLRDGLLQGYTPIVWTLVLNNAFNGLAISAILRYTDNIVRVFAHAAAMMLTMALEVGLFGASPTPQLLISATVCGCAVYLYNRASPPPPIASPPRSPPPSRAAAAHGAEQQPLLGVGAEGEEEEVQLPPLFPMLTRGADGVYHIRTTRALSDP